MIQINLLPWREQARKQEKTRLAIAAGACAGLALVFVIVFHIHYSSQIGEQSERNRTLESALNKENAELFSLKRKKEELGEINKQLGFIFALRDSSYRAVRVLNELAMVNPDTITLNKVIRKGNIITVIGKAKSELQITLFMDAIEQSKFFNQPSLTEISSKEGKVGRERSFQLRVELQG